MKKSDLFEKVESYNKFASHSDRAEFLKKLASLSDSDKAGIDSAMKDLATLAPSTGKETHDLLQKFYYGEKTDMTELAAALNKAANIVGANADNINQAQRINDLAVKLRPSKEVSVEGKPSFVQQPVNFAPISKDIQQILSDVSVTNGLGLPLAIDGKLGTNTRAAINAIKNKFMGGKGTDQEVFEKAKELLAKPADKNMPVSLDPEFEAKPVAGPNKSSSLLSLVSSFEKLAKK